MSKDELDGRRDAAKAAGDAAYRSGQYHSAIEHYSQGISLDPGAVVLYSNRSAAYLKVSRMEEALNDTEMCISLGTPTTTTTTTLGTKILARKATALQALTRYGEALPVWMEVSDRNKNFELAKNNIKICEEAIAGRDMLNWNAPFTKKDASNLFGEFCPNFDQALFDDFLATFLPIPGKSLPGSDASQKVQFIMTAMIVKEIPTQRRNESTSKKVQVRRHYSLPRGALLRIKEDEAFASKVYVRAFLVFFDRVTFRNFLLSSMS